jgi:hypothetical protein
MQWHWLSTGIEIGAMKEKAVADLKALFESLTRREREVMASQSAPS